MLSVWQGAIKFYFWAFGMTRPGIEPLSPGPFANQFSISTVFSSIWHIVWTLSVVTTPGLSGPGSDGNERVHCTVETSSITGASRSDCFVSYPGHSLRESYPSAAMQSVYSATQADLATWHSLRESYPSAAMQSVYSAAQADLATWHSLRESYPSAAMQSVYSAAPTKLTGLAEGLGKNTYCNHR